MKGKAELIFEDPPPPQRIYLSWRALVDQCKAHPDQWARVLHEYTYQGGGIDAHAKTYGLETRFRRQENGKYWLWIRWPAPERTGQP